MTRLTAARPAHAAPRRAEDQADRCPGSGGSATRYWRLQLGCFLAWSTLLYHRFALTLDFAIYHQAWFLIAHGNLDPYSSLKVMTFWRSNCEFYPWLLACLYWVWPHGVVLLWVQDAGVVVAEWVAFTWLCELAGRHRPGRDAAWLAGAGLVLLAADPWIWWSVSFDFHEEGLAIAFVALLARDLVHGRRRVWAWVLPVLAAGAPAATYVAGLGLGGVLAGRRSRVPGAIMSVIGVGYSLLVVFIHGDLGSTLAHHYGYLVGTAGGYASSKLTFGGLAKGIASHPLNVLQTLWSRRPDIVANLAPAGLLGVFFSLLSPVLLLALLTDILSLGLVYAQPTFQALPIYVLLPVGTVAILAWLSRRRPQDSDLAGRTGGRANARLGGSVGPADSQPVAAGACSQRGHFDRPRGGNPGLGRGDRVPGCGRALLRPAGGERAGPSRQAAGKWRRHLVHHRPVDRHRRAADGERDGAHSGTRRSHARHPDNARQWGMGVSVASARGHPCDARPG